MNRLLGLSGAIGGAAWLILYLGGEPRFLAPGTPRFDLFVAFGRWTPGLLALIGLGFLAALAQYRTHFGRIGRAGLALIIGGLALMFVSRLAKFWLLPLPVALPMPPSWVAASTADGAGLVGLLAGAGLACLALFRGGAPHWLAMSFGMLPILTLFGVPTNGDALPLGVLGFVLGAVAALRSPTPSTGQGALA